MATLESWHEVQLAALGEITGNFDMSILVQARVLAKTVPVAPTQAPVAANSSIKVLENTPAVFDKLVLITAAPSGPRSFL